MQYDQRTNCYQTDTLAERRRVMRALARIRSLPLNLQSAIRNRNAPPSTADSLPAPGALAVARISSTSETRGFMSV